MKKIVIVLVLSTAYYTLVFGQEYYISSGVNYTPNSESRSSTETELHQYTILNDSMNIRTKNLYQSTSTYQFSANLGYYLNAHVVFSLNDRFKIETGVGLHLNSFHQDFDFTLGTHLKELGRDTVNRNIFNPGSGSDLCDKFTNSSFDVIPKEGKEYFILTLNLPLQLSYDILQGRWQIGLGGFLNTPIYSSERYEQRAIKSNEEAGKTCCTFVVEKIKDERGTDMRNLQFGYMAHTSYRIGSRVSIEMRFLQNLQNIFTQADNYFHDSHLRKYKPINLQLGICYLLNRATGLSEGKM